MLVEPDGDSSYCFSWANYCLGWAKTANGEIVHTGNTTGCNALVGFISKERIGFVVLANEDIDEFNELLVHYALACMTNNQEQIMEFEKVLTQKASIMEDEKPEKKNILLQEITAEQAAKFAGTYHNDIFGNFVIKADKTALTLTYDVIDVTLELGVADKDTLKNADDELTLIVKRNGLGEIEKIELEIEDGCRYEFVKIS